MRTTYFKKLLSVAYIHASITQTKVIMYKPRWLFSIFQSYWLLKHITISYAFYCIPLHSLYAVSTVSSMMLIWITIYINDYSLVWICLCFKKLLPCWNIFPHTSHTCGFSPVWIRQWVFKLSSRANCLLHVLHICGFSPVWINACLFRFPSCTNSFLHTLHEYGFSLVWISMWVFRWRGCENSLPHMLHTYGLSPVWILQCVFKWYTDLNPLLHTSHLKGLSPVCTNICDFSLLGFLKTLPHSPHTWKVCLLHGANWVLSTFFVCRLGESPLQPAPSAQFSRLFNSSQLKYSL